MRPKIDGVRSSVTYSIPLMCNPCTTGERRKVGLYYGKLIHVVGAGSGYITRSAFTYGFLEGSSATLASHTISSAWSVEQLCSMMSLNFHEKTP